MNIPPLPPTPNTNQTNNPSQTNPSQTNTTLLMHVFIQFLKSENLLDQWCSEIVYSEEDEDDYDHLNITVASFYRDPHNMVSLSFSWSIAAKRLSTDPSKPTPTLTQWADLSARWVVVCTEAIALLLQLTTDNVSR